MKTLTLPLLLLMQLIVAPLSMAESAHDWLLESSHEIEQSSYIDPYLPCTEVTTETVESIQKNSQQRLLHEQQYGVPDTSDKHDAYDFVIDHHKCDWIIRSSEPDP